MKNTINFPLLLVILLALTLIPFSSCRKKEEKIETEQTETDDEQGSAMDNNSAENFAVELESMGAELSENNELMSFRESDSKGISDVLGASPCATVSGLGTRTFTVDFGTSGCIGQDGRTRTGKLVFDFSASSPSTAVYYRNPGFSMSVSSQNYVVDNFTVNIFNKNVTNTTPASIPSGVNPGTNLTWAITASISISKPNNGGIISWSCIRSKELVNTADSACYKGQGSAINWRKAIVKLNGTSSGVNARQENYTSVATNLIRDWSCSPDPQRPRRHPFIGGTLSYQPANRFNRLINYGNGSSCDLNATLTINGRTVNISI